MSSFSRKECSRQSEEDADDSQTGNTNLQVISHITKLIIFYDVKEEVATLIKFFNICITLQMIQKSDTIQGKNKKKCFYIKHNFKHNI